MLIIVLLLFNSLLFSSMAQSPEPEPITSFISNLVFLDNRSFFLKEAQEFFESNVDLVYYYGLTEEDIERISIVVVGSCTTLDQRFNPRVLVSILALISEHDLSLGTANFGEWTETTAVELWTSYIAFEFEQSRWPIHLKDGTEIEPPPSVNGASWAIMRVLSRLARSQAEWENMIGRDEGSFYNIYGNFFTNPLTVELENTIVTAAAPFLYRPWNVSQYPSVHINSWFDHQYPLGLGSWSCPNPPLVDGHLTKYTGQIFYNQTVCSCNPSAGTCYDRHDGIDFALPNGTRIYPAANGTIVYSTDCVILIDHGNGYRTLYGDCISNSGYTGPVARGTLLGYVDTGNHLHFEVDRGYGTARTDPYGWCGDYADPWTIHPEGTISEWLWADQPYPCSSSQCCCKTYSMSALDSCAPTPALAVFPLPNATSALSLTPVPTFTSLLTLDPTSTPFPISTPISLPSPTSTPTAAEAHIAQVSFEAIRTPPASASYRIARSVFGSGGGPKTSAYYVMQGTSGQTTGVAWRQSSSYVLRSGYWGRIATHSAPYAIYLPIVLK
jgi:murein DD-endopeptidase MepM/ murein hydrolase activator NlpD